MYTNFFLMDNSSMISLFKKLGPELILKNSMFSTLYIPEPIESRICLDIV